MEFGILGPLQLLDRGGQAHQPRGRQRDLLALLVVCVHQVVRSDRLVEALWGEDPPANPANALQQRVFAVRKMLGDHADVLATVTGGYRLEVDDEAIDARRFEQFADDGHDALRTGNARQAVQSLDDALALWRGTPLEGIDAPWATAEVVRLTERRLVACEDRIDAQLLLGHHRTVIAELEALVVELPLRERLHGQLMVALAGLGRQADALEVYNRLRGRLVDELGIDPSPQLQQTHHDVLTQQVRSAPTPAESSSRPTGTGAVSADGRGGPPLLASASTFVGRAAETDQLAELLASNRLVTICGPGGAGKTRIGVETVRRSAAADRRVWLLELASLERAADLLPSAAVALHAGRSGGAGPLDAICDVLSGGPALLVLDNCEHLAAAVTDLAGQLLQRCPELTVLATSREPLGLEGETIWPIPLLSVPPADTGDPAAALTFSAVQLFCDRAGVARPGFGLTTDDVADVVSVVRRLDGLPLAIELAAARLRFLSVGELASGLDERFRLLATTRRDRDERHRTLWNTLEWSWDLLDGDVQRAWVAASVPSGPFTTDLLELLLGPIGCQLDSFDAIEQLCDRSLLTVHEPGTPTRYRMLETIREYGRQQLTSTDRHHEVRQAHADAVEQVFRDTDRTDERIWRVDLDRQRTWLPELRTALRWRLQVGDLRGAQRLAAAPGWLWYLTTLGPEGLNALNDTLGPLERLDRDAVEPAAVLWSAILRVSQAPHDNGLAWAKLASELVRSPVERTLAEVYVANHLAVVGQVEEALALARAHHQVDGWLAGTWHLLTAQLLTLRDQTDKADEQLAAAQQLLVGGGAWWGVWAAASLVQLAQLRGDANAVLAVAQRALDVCAVQDLSELEIELRSTLAMVAAVAGDHAHADDQLNRAEQLVRVTDLSSSAALVANARGYRQLRTGNPAAATSSFETALELHDRAGQAFGRPFSLWGLGHVALADGDMTRARRQHHAAAQAAQQQGDHDALARSVEGLAATLATETTARLGARLLGAAAVRRGHIGSPRPVIGGDEAATTEREIRGLLDGATFENERHAGGQLDDDQLATLVATAER